MSTPTTLGEEAARRVITELGPTGSIVKSATALSGRHLIQAAEACDASRSAGSCAGGRGVDDSLLLSVKWERVALANLGRTLDEFVCPTLGPEAKSEIESMMKSKYQTMLAMVSDHKHPGWRGCKRGCSLGRSRSASAGEGDTSPRPDSPVCTSTWSAQREGRASLPPTKDA
jgi:hypothetical protein